jgi:hypothetical protein
MSVPRVPSSDAVPRHGAYEMLRYAHRARHAQPNTHMSQEELDSIACMVNSPDFKPSLDPAQLRDVRQFIAHQLWFAHIPEGYEKLFGDTPATTQRIAYVKKLLFNEEILSDVPDIVQDVCELYQRMVRFLSTHGPLSAKYEVARDLLVVDTHESTPRTIMSLVVDTPDDLAKLKHRKGFGYLHKEFAVQLLVEPSKIYELSQTRLQAVLDACTTNEEVEYVLMAAQPHHIMLNMCNSDVIHELSAYSLVRFNCPVTIDLLEGHLMAETNPRKRIGITQLCGLSVNEIRTIGPHLSYIQCDDLPMEIAQVLVGCDISLRTASFEVWQELAAKRITHLTVRGDNHLLAMHAVMQHVRHLRVIGDLNVLDVESKSPKDMSINGDVDLKKHNLLVHLRLSDLTIIDNSLLTPEVLTELVSMHAKHGLIRVHVIRCSHFPSDYLPDWSRIVDYKHG